MKRFWIVLLSLVMIAAFSTAALAVDVTFRGDYYLQGFYNKNYSMLDKDSYGAGVYAGSTALYASQAHMGADFQIVQGLSFQVGFVGLDGIVGGARLALPSTALTGANESYAQSAWNQQNIRWTVAGIKFVTPIGLFTAGRLEGSRPAFGTAFNDGAPFGADHTVSYTVPLMNNKLFLTAAMYMKYNEGTTGINPATGAALYPVGSGTDIDNDRWVVQAIYRWDSGSAGIRPTWLHYRFYDAPNAILAGAGLRQKIDWLAFEAYFKQKFGIIYAELEIANATSLLGKRVYHDFAGNKTKEIKDMDPWDWSLLLHVNADLAPAKVGFQFVYSPADDPNTTDQQEGGQRTTLDLDHGYNPCLVFWNDDYLTWFGGGSIYRSNGTYTPNGVILGAIPATANSMVKMTTALTNVWMYQIYGSFQVNPKLSAFASYTYAYADKKPTVNMLPVSATNPEFVSDKYGSEVDVTLTYKIYDNLSYMLGGAYVFVGDYFKGTNANAKLSNTYLLTHKLSFSF